MRSRHCVWTLAALLPVAAAVGLLRTSPSPPRSPPVWPLRFRATLFQNRTDRLALTTLYYDVKRGVNVNVVASQLGATLFDVEWNNGTSFIFSHSPPTCKVLHFDVGLLTPDWLKNATYLGQTDTDSFVCDVWTKAAFIDYYAELDSGRPVRWTFLGSGAEFHVLQWVPGESLPRGLAQAPAHCFVAANGSDPDAGPAFDSAGIATGHMLRPVPAVPAGGGERGADDERDQQTVLPKVPSPLQQQQQQQQQQQSLLEVE